MPSRQLKYTIKNAVPFFTALHLYLLAILVVLIVFVAILIVVLIVLISLIVLVLVVVLVTVFHLKILRYSFCGFPHV